MYPDTHQLILSASVMSGISPREIETWTECEIREFIAAHQAHAYYKMS